MVAVEPDLGEWHRKDSSWEYLLDLELACGLDLPRPRCHAMPPFDKGNYSF